jgi:hypothetical protein
MALSIIESRKISRQIRDNLAKVNAGGVSIIQSRSMSKAIKSDLALLNGTATNTPENAFVVFLRQVVTGTKDNLGLGPLLAQIDEAITGLNGGGLLVGEAEEVADKAITHWAELEERQAA